MNKLINIILLPLDVILLVISFVTVLCKFLYRRFKTVEGDLRGFIPTKIHKFKLWRKDRAKR